MVEGGEFMDTNLISSLIDEKVFGVWFLIGAALVFWMQAGFAMVECGFARAKNAGNIIMKNLMDFCIGTVVFIAIGFGLFLGEDMLMGFMGKPNIDIFSNYATFDWSNFVLTLYSVPQQQRSYQVLWQREQDSYLTAYIPQLSQQSSILSKLTGHGAAAGFQ